MIPFNPFQNLYQHIKQADIKLFQTLDRISQALQLICNTAVSTAETYYDPNWLLSLDWDKINNVPPFILGPAAPDKSIQFNDAGAFAGEDILNWDKTNNRLGVNKIAPGYTIDAVGDCNITGAYRVNGTPLSSSGNLQYAASTSTLTLTNSLQSVPGASLTINRAGLYLVTGVFDFSNQSDGGNYLIGTMNNFTANAIYQIPLPATAGRSTVAQQWVASFTVGQIAQLQAYKTGGTGTSFVSNIHTTISALWIPS